MTNPAAPDRKAEVVVVGGGIAGLEALLALRDLAPDAASVTLVSAGPEFVYRPLTVEEPFSGDPAERHELAPLVAEEGGRFVLGSLESVDPEARSIRLTDGEEIPYDFLILCLGTLPRAAYDAATTLRVNGEPNSIDGLIEQADADESKTLAVVVPPGVSWPLPAYELALMARQRTEQVGRRDVRIELVTPEAGPLELFGSAGRDSLAELLKARRIGVHLSSSATESDQGLVMRPGGELLQAGAVLSLPVLAGPAPSGIDCDEKGFIPVDEHSRVKGAERVFAAGDGTNFPIKQGGIATQQADAAAEQIALELGVRESAEPFQPILRGQLLTGGSSLHLRHEITGGHGEGVASYEQLWWPPQKVAGRYLAGFFANTQPGRDLDVPEGSMGVEFELPKEWHEQPMALDPVSRRRD